MAKKRKSTRRDIDHCGNVWTTKITRLANGYGARVLRNGEVVQQNRLPLPDRQSAGEALKDMLRMVDKLGYCSSMADRSRHRRKNNL